QYATLSHCWGNAKALRLTAASFRDLSTGVAISELAKIFQDAIFTARSLGIGLLWIDSLCILQDSEEDWQGESAVMSEIYRNGVA
ncbi:heterokaryon incompatibility, partial [Decorospora gaudefroyi]